MIDKNKVYKTRDGYETRIYATDGGKRGDEVHGAYNTGEFGWWPFTWSKDGKAFPYQREHNLDLIEVKPRIKRTVWMNVYREHEATHPCKHIADSHAEPDRLACIPIEIDVEDKS